MALRRVAGADRSAVPARSPGPRRTPHGDSPYPEGVVPFLTGQYRGILDAVQTVTGRPIKAAALRESVAMFNRLRGQGNGPTNGRLKKPEWQKDLVSCLTNEL